VEENTADLVEPPSEIEVNHAITAKMRNLLVMVCFSYSTIALLQMLFLLLADESRAEVQKSTGEETLTGSRRYAEQNLALVTLPVTRHG
jgi:hypothetical protein